MIGRWRLFFLDHVLNSPNALFRVGVLDLKSKFGKWIIFIPGDIMDSVSNSGWRNFQFFSPVIVAPSGEAKAPPLIS